MKHIQLLETTKNTLQHIIGLNPDRISVFNDTHLPERFMPFNKGLTLLQEGELKQAVIKQLICHSNLAFDDIKQRFQIEPQQYFAKELESLKRFEEDRLLSLSPQGIQVHDKGVLLIRSICIEFDEYLTRPQQGIRYSKVI